MSQTDPKVIVALDFPDAEPAQALAEKLNPELCRLKVGKELFVRAGPAFVEKAQQLGFEIFLDLKFHDIPNTVAAACRAAAELGVWMVNVHAMGGFKMMQEAADAIAACTHKPQLIAVTILTSLDQSDLQGIGMRGGLASHVDSLSALAQRAGLSGVVCSALEAAALRAARGEDFLLVTPGIRLPDSGQDDQKRTMTPKQAIESGSSYLVIGRPVTQALDPLEALEKILSEL